MNGASEVNGEGGFRSYLLCPWPGEAALLKFDEKRFVGIYTDHKLAAGVFMVDGQNDHLAMELAKYFEDRYQRGKSATEVFYGLLKQFGIDEVVEVDRLDRLLELYSIYRK